MLLFSGNSFSCAANAWGQYSWTTETTAAQYVQRQFLFLYGKILQSITTKTTFGSRSWIAAQEKEIPNQIWGKPFFLCVSTVSALSHAICQSDSKVICISSDYCIKWDVPWVFEFCRLHGGQFQIFTHHTGALCIRQVIVVVIFLLLPELWPLGSFLFAHVSLA